MIIHKAYKVRLYPTKRQEAELLKILAGCRFVWNYFLEKRQKHYLEHKKTISYAKLSKELTQLRKTTRELEGIQIMPLQQTLRRLDVSYGRFFRKQSRFPRFKTEWDDRQSFQRCKDWRITGKRVLIQSGLSIETRGRLPKEIGKIGSLIVRKEADRWFASIFVQEECRPARRYTKPIGIDVGLKHLAVTSKGKKYDTLKPDYALHDEMKKLQKKMARQVMGSKRREGTRLRIARLYQRINNIRTNHIHQTTNKILNRNPSAIVIEDLNVIGMMKNHSLARSLADVSLAELHRQLKYKQTWRGGKVVELDRFFPSSKTCHKCGYINEDLTLATRNWKCPKCKTKHDRDVNAAKVILRQG